MALRDVLSALVPQPVMPAVPPPLMAGGMGMQQPSFGMGFTQVAGGPEDEILGLGGINSPETGSVVGGEPALPVQQIMPDIDFQNQAAGQRVPSIRAYHVTDAPFERYDWGRLGNTTRLNQTGDDPWATNLAGLGPWASQKDITGKMGFKHSLPVDVGGKGKSFKSLDALERFITDKGSAEKARQALVEQGYGHVVVNDEEFGGKSFVGLAPGNFTIVKP